MENSDKLLLDLGIKINSESVLFFDMDGTLVDTNIANHLAYKKAMRSIGRSDFDVPYNASRRINRGVLKSIISLSDSEYERVIIEKERCYEEFLSETKLNSSIAGVLIKYHKTNRTVLVTNCRENRASMTLNHHGLAEKFSEIFCRQVLGNEEHINKYKRALACLKVSAQSVIVFENEEREINDALAAGIPIQNILIL